MYLHIGGDVLVKKKDIIAIIDYENVEKSQITDEFVELASIEGLIEKKEKKTEAKAFVVSDKKIYFSSISSATLFKRSL